MSSGARLAKRALLGGVARALTGRGIGPGEREAVERDLAQVGFRKAGRALLLRRMAAAALAHGGMTILAPALGGRFRIACNGDDFGVGWEILEHGTYEPHLVSFYQRMLRPGMTVVDVVRTSASTRCTRRGSSALRDGSSPSSPTRETPRCCARA